MSTSDKAQEPCVWKHPDELRENRRKRKSRSTLASLVPCCKKPDREDMFLEPRQTKGFTAWMMEIFIGGFLSMVLSMFQPLFDSVDVNQIPARLGIVEQEALEVTLRGVVKTLHEKFETQERFIRQQRSDFKKIALKHEGAIIALQDDNQALADSIGLLLNMKDDVDGLKAENRGIERVLADIRVTQANTPERPAMNKLHETWMENLSEIREEVEYLKDDITTFNSSLSNEVKGMSSMLLQCNNMTMTKMQGLKLQIEQQGLELKTDWVKSEDFNELRQLCHRFNKFEELESILKSQESHMSALERRIKQNQSPTPTISRKSNQQAQSPRPVQRSPKGAHETTNDAFLAESPIKGSPGKVRSPRASLKKKRFFTNKR